ncbi:hypothetical protein CDAR_10671 [Caerostris darwini]|uniref:Peptidase aspartic putative domain-containing protein n=1 Tax=Caerostris darwini TaxID=1538125 RepID=A0AAV4SWP1_9ARAC|nr:hypothetical protein CDAR_10671 [Caerostris darwini]
MLIDSGSEKSLFTIQLTSELKPPVIRKEHLIIYTFGRNEVDEKEFDVYQLRIRRKQQYHQTLLDIKVHATDNIISFFEVPPNFRRFQNLWINLIRCLLIDALTKKKKYIQNSYNVNTFAK